MENKGRKYVFVLDYEDGRAYRYDVWIDDSEKIEDYLTDMGHSMGNCEWMVTRFKTSNKIIWIVEKLTSKLKKR